MPPAGRLLLPTVPPSVLGLLCPCRRGTGRHPVGSMCVAGGPLSRASGSARVLPCAAQRPFLCRWVPWLVARSSSGQRFQPLCSALCGQALRKPAAMCSVAQYGVPGDAQRSPLRPSGPAFMPCSTFTSNPSPWVQAGHPQLRTPSVSSPVTDPGPRRPGSGHSGAADTTVSSRAVLPPAALWGHLSVGITLQ